MKEEDSVVFFKSCQHLNCLSCLEGESKCLICLESNESPTFLQDDPNLMEFYRKIKIWTLPRKEILDDIDERYGKLAIKREEKNYLLQVDELRSVSTDKETERIEKLNSGTPLRLCKGCAENSLSAIKMGKFDEKDASKAAGETPISKPTNEPLYKEILVGVVPILPKKNVASELKKTQFDGIEILKKDENVSDNTLQETDEESETKIKENAHENLESEDDATLMDKCVEGMKKIKLEDN